jgi:hypothetical protein
MDLFEQCQDKSIEFFSEIFAESLDLIPILLNEKINFAGNDNQRRRYLEGRKAIDAGRQVVLDACQQSLRQAFDDFSAGRDSIREQRKSSAQLALVDKAQFEDDVAIRSMASKANAANSEELWKLNRRFAVLRGGCKCADDINPCGPLQVCNAMRDAYQAIDLDAGVRLLLYKCFDQQVLAKAGALYTMLNQRLARHGVLKTLHFEVAQSSRRVASSVAGAGGAASAAASQAGGAPPANYQSRGSSPGAANDAAHLAVGGAPQGDAQPGFESALVNPDAERRQERVMEAISAVQQRRRESDQPRTLTMGGASYGGIALDGVAGQGDTFSQRELAIALGVLQAALQLPAARQAVPRRVIETENRLIGELGALGKKSDRQKVDASDADTIDLVGMLFNFMLDDEQLPDSLKSLLSHLHTPYLKVALLDKKFFASARHPARCLLDLMAAAGARWVREGEDDEKVYQRIRGVVERIIHEFDQDLGFFDELLADFVGFVKVLERRADLAAQRSVEAEKGLDQLSEARELAGREIVERIAGAVLPDPLLELLQQPWTDLLVFNYLRHGSASESWRAALDVVQSVVDSTRVDPGRDRAELEAAHTSLNTEIEAGLNSLGYDRDHGQRLLQALRDAQQQALQGEPPKLDTQIYTRVAPPARSAIARQIQHERASQIKQQKTAPQAESPQKSQADKSPLQLQPSRPKPRHVSRQEKMLAEKLSRVSFGTWFEFRQGMDGPAQRLRLSWYSSISGNYMFVNHSGVKTAVKTLPELLRGMNEGNIIMLDAENKNFFERALSSVLGKLNKS